MQNLITQKNFNVTMKLFDKFLDRFRPDELVKLEVTSPDYKRISIVWGLYEFEKGERRTIYIYGPKGFINAALKQLNQKSLMIEKVSLLKK